MPDRRPRLLFVCVENSCRSQMAEGFARALGAGRIHAASAGSNPSGRVDPRAVSFMKEKGIDMTAHRSSGLEELHADEPWDVVVTMGCGDACPHVPAVERLDWDLPDPKGSSDEEFRRVRDRIEALVREVLVRAAGGAGAGREEA